MLLNLYNNKNDAKFRTINLSNKAFQSKLASVPGGVELLLAAGYRYEANDSLNDSTKWDASRSMSGESETFPASSDYREGLLVHSMDKLSERKLGYALSRLKELLEMQGTAV